LRGLSETEQRYHLGHLSSSKNWWVAGWLSW